MRGSGSRSVASPGGWSGSQYDMMSYQEAARSGQIQDTPLNKIQHKFWVTKQAVARKLGKEEDQHVVASDCELDAKLELFRFELSTFFSALIKFRFIGLFTKPRVDCRG